MNFDDVIELKEELLRTYRRLVRVQAEKEFISGRLTQANDKLKKSEETLANERFIHEVDHKGWHETFRNMDEENVYLTVRNVDLEKALFAVIDDALNLEHFQRPFLPAPTPPPEPPKFVEVVPGVMPADEDNAPVLCLSCNNQKEGGCFFCDVCFDLTIDHGNCDLFEELVDAWGRGDRDFPRPGKNAKELYKK